MKQGILSGGMQQDMNNASPELQQEYDIFVSNGIRIIHGNAREAIINQLKGQEPADAVAMATVGVIERIESGAADKGKKINESVLLNGANELMNNIIELGEGSGAIKEMSEDDRVNAVKKATGMYIKNALESGKMTKEQLVQDAEALKQQFGEKSDPGQSPLARPRGYDSVAGVRG